MNLFLRYPFPHKKALTPMVLQFVAIPSTHSHNYTSICFILHGLGDSGNGWAQVARILSRKFPMTKFILPHAPEKRITLNRGYSMPAWYDIIELRAGAQQDQEGILQSAQEILKLVAAEESKGISRDKIVIGGFSQGGAIALTTGLLFKSIEKQRDSFDSARKFGGIMALSTYLPIKDHFMAHKDEIPVETPIYMSHGTSDQVISYDWADKSKTALKRELKCKDLTFETVPNVGHSINENVIESMVKFLKKVFE